METPYEKLRKLFRKIRVASKTIRSYMGYFDHSLVDFVGYKVNDRETVIEDEKLTSIQEAPFPMTKQQVRSFLGLAEYY